MQQQALDNVNTYLDQLLLDFKTDTNTAKETLQCYINACLSESKGPIHQKFQAAVLECTAYDQKQTRKKLETLMESFRVEKIWEYTVMNMINVVLSGAFI